MPLPVAFPPPVHWRFPDVQAVLVSGLAVWSGMDADTETPPNLADVLPFARVVRSGGGRNRVDDRAIVEIDLFDSTYAACEDLAERISQWLCGPPPPFAVFDKVECDIGPRELPWGTGTIRRMNAVYGIVARRVRIPG